MSDSVHARELVVDAFAGGGGASLGIEMALGASPDIAINHDAVAIGMHAANHPSTIHLNSNIWKVDPADVEPGRPIGLLWASPDCTFHSKAKGGVPIRHEGRMSRDLGWIVVLWAERRRPRVIIVENVEEWADWGPLVEVEDGRLRPCRKRKGETFQRWVRELRRLGYRVEWREIRACDLRTPTIRKRLYVIARCDSEPIVWPKPTHGPVHNQGGSAHKPSSPAHNLRPYRTAAEIIDWSIPCPSIFDSAEEIMRKHGVRAIRPLAENTMARIARGVKRYVLDAAEPFIIPITHTGDARTYGIGEPLRTVTTAHRGEHALVMPYFVPRYGERPGQEPRTRSADEPMSAIVPTANGGSLVAAFLAQHNTDMVGHDARNPVSTIVGKGSTQAVVSAGLINMRGSASDQLMPRSVEAPIAALTAHGTHAAEVRAFLLKYYGADQDPRLGEPLHTATAKARFGLVTVTIGGEAYAIVDIGMRMLIPRELFRGNGFPESYIIDRRADGTPITKTDQIRMVGNSVCPPVAEALVRANYAPREVGADDLPAFTLQAAE